MFDIISFILIMCLFCVFCSDGINKVYAYDEKSKITNIINKIKQNEDIFGNRILKLLETEYNKCISDPNYDMWQKYVDSDGKKCIFYISRIDTSKFDDNSLAYYNVFPEIAKNFSQQKYDITKTIKIKPIEINFKHRYIDIFFYIESHN